MYDFHFYHHVSTEYIKELRRRLIAALHSSKPRFVVKGKLGPFPRGRDTTRRFPELEQVIANQYRPVLDRRGFTIYERKDR
jgi:hypothetical protein